MPQSLIHLSDLHIGRSAADERCAQAFVDRAMVERIDHVVVTGDLTNRGRREELSRFHEIFAPLHAARRLTLVPGNHDRLGHDVAGEIQQGARVETKCLPGLYLIRFDSTGPHNRSWLAGHGAMSGEDIEAILEAAHHAPAGHLVVLLLHHHPLPLPEDNTAELLSSWLGWRWTAELELGWTLLRSLAGHCDLVLHGHRHRPRSFSLFEETPRPLRIFNAGSSTEMGVARVFAHAQGQLEGPAVWWRHSRVSRQARHVAAEAVHVVA